MANELESSLISHPHQASVKEASLLSSLITKVGNFSVQYNYQAISIALIVMSVVKCTSTIEKCKDGDQDSWVTSSATATVFVGSITGQLSMGYAGDVLGRDVAMGLTIGLAATSALLSAVATVGSAANTYIGIIICRFFLGIGLGGVYPLAATKAAEDGSKGGANPAASAKSFFWQMPGSMAPWIVVLILVKAGVDNKMMWRLLLGLGCIPSIFVVACVYLESTDKQYVRQHGPSFDAGTIEHNQKDLTKGFRDPTLWLKLIGTGGGWFIFDVCYYGVGLFGGAIISAMGSDVDDVTTNEQIIDVAWKQVVALGMGIPASLLTIYLMDKYTLKQLQIAGFLLFVIGFVAMSVAFFPLKKSNPDLLFALYCFLLFALQFGPNVTTYTIPATVYKKEVRSTMNGFSAASGKLGAVVGAYLFGTVADLSSLPTIMVLCAIISVFGAYFTYKFVPEPLQEDTENSNEDSKAPFMRA